jgi:hypothetical protein
VFATAGEINLEMHSEMETGVAQSCWSEKRFKLL